MIRVELGGEIENRGVWRWTCPRYGVAGRSRQPLLDACREIKRMGGDPADIVGLFREARSMPDMTCTIGVGEGLTVDESRTPRFAKWKPRPEFATKP